MSSCLCVVKRQILVAVYIDDAILCISRDLQIIRRSDVDVILRVSGRLTVHTDHDRIFFRSGRAFRRIDHRIAAGCDVADRFVAGLRLFFVRAAIRQITVSGCDLHIFSGCHFVNRRVAVCRDLYVFAGCNRSDLGFAFDLFHVYAAVCRFGIQTLRGFVVIGHNPVITEDRIHDPFAGLAVVANRTGLLSVFPLVFCHLHSQDRRRFSLLQSDRIVIRTDIFRSFECYVFSEDLLISVSGRQDAAIVHNDTDITTLRVNILSLQIRSGRISFRIFSACYGNVDAAFVVQICHACAGADLNVDRLRIRLLIILCTRRCLRLAECVFGQFFFFFIRKQ